MYYLYASRYYCNKKFKIRLETEIIRLTSLQKFYNSYGTIKKINHLFKNLNESKLKFVKILNNFVIKMLFIGTLIMVQNVCIHDLTPCKTFTKFILNN